MTRIVQATLLAFFYRLAAGALFGAQLFFAAVAAPSAFPRAVAALPAGHPSRTAAADLVGVELAALDRMALACAALAVLCAVLLWRRGAAPLRAALPPLLIGLCAATSSALVTPAIHSLRAQGATGTPLFGRLHALSTALVLVELLLGLLAVWRAPSAE